MALNWHERVLSEEDLKKVEENDGDVYCLFSMAQLVGYGVYGARIIDRNGQKILQFEMGSSCD